MGKNPSFHPVNNSLYKDNKIEKTKVFGQSGSKICWIRPFFKLNKFLFSVDSKNGIHTDEIRRLYEEMENLLTQEREKLKRKVMYYCIKNIVFICPAK